MRFVRDTARRRHSAGRRIASSADRRKRRGSRRPKSKSLPWRRPRGVGLAREREELVRQFRDWLVEATAEPDESAPQSRRWCATSTHELFAPAAWVTTPPPRQPGPPLSRQHNELVQRFRDWLARTSGEAGELPEVGEPAEAAAVGLLQLVEAFTAVRHELKLQTKSSRGLAESVQAALAGLDDASDQLRSVQPREEESAERAMRPLVESLISLDEALQRGLKATEATQTTGQTASDLVLALDRRFEQLPAWRRWWFRHWHNEAKQVCRQQVVPADQKAVDSLREGYRLLCSRLQRDLSQHGISRIACLGQTFDPMRMTVVSVVHDSDAAPETVVEEVRPGYLWRDNVVRFAEVCVAKKNPDPVDVAGPDPSEVTAH